MTRSMQRNAVFGMIASFAERSPFCRKNRMIQPRHGTKDYDTPIQPQSERLKRRTQWVWLSGKEMGEATPVRCVPSDSADFLS